MSKAAKVLVTGANGFVGRHVMAHLNAVDVSCVGSVRRAKDRADERVVTGDITPTTDWGRCVDGIDAIVHTAAHVHAVDQGSLEAQRTFERVNVLGTANLARQAAAAGVRRFVLVSSIKVNGEETTLGSPFTNDDRPEPVGPYAVSKFRGEAALWEVAGGTGMEAVVIRPPLIHGPGVGGNFARLVRLACSGWPLPIGGVLNRRSFVGIDNLVDLLHLAIFHPAAEKEVLFVSDGEDMSTPELVRRIAQLSGRPTRLLRIPPRVLFMTARAVGREGQVRRLAGSLQVDISRTRELLGWRPKCSVDDGLRQVLA